MHAPHYKGNSHFTSKRKKKRIKLTIDIEIARRLLTVEEFTKFFAKVDVISITHYKSFNTTALVSTSFILAFVYLG